MPKICNQSECSNPVWGKGYCQWHQYLRTDKKPKVRQYQKEVKPYEGINDLSVDREVEMYKILWENEPHISFLSGKPINIIEGSSFWYNIFAHVLAKGKAMYPKYKLYSKNIIFLTPEEHLLLDHCSFDKREEYAKENNCDWKVVYDLKEELSKEYKVTFS